MIQTIIKRFEDINQTYEMLLLNSEAIFVSLKTKEFEELDLLNGKRAAGLQELEEKLVQLKNEISLACSQLHIKEIGIRSLEPYMNLSEKEQIMAHQRDAFHFEKKLKNNTKVNQCLVEAMMACSQTIVETWVHVASQENQTNAFMNKKF